MHALDVSGLSKTFLNRQVLKSVALTVGRGEIVGLVGQNGCGKSTLIKIISGVYEPDRGGSMQVLGRPVPLPIRPGGVEGLSFVHQDLGLFLEGSVLENLRVGRYRTGPLWRIDWRAERAACERSLALVGLDVDPETRVADLSPIDRALVAIARAVDRAQAAGGAGVIVLDEPTSYLPHDGVAKLFEAVRELREAGMGVIFVSHRIEEVLELCDSIVVLREGAVVARLAAAGATQEQVVEAMLGRRLNGYYPEAVATPADRPLALAVTGLSGAGLSELSFSVRAGEIYGVTGLLGMGQERLLYLTIGAVPARGTLRCGATEMPLQRMTPRLARDMGLALLPADRGRASGVQEASVMENMTLATLERYTHFGRIRHAAEAQAAEGLVRDFDVRPPDPQAQLRTLSGGNQQKALLAKWMNARPRVLLLHEPTQGVDVGAKQQIFALLRQAADAGVAIIIATTEYEDLAALCDRVMVMREGRAAAELAGAALTHERLVEECYKSERRAA